MDHDPPSLLQRGFVEVSRAKDLPDAFRNALLSRARPPGQEPASKPWELCPSLQNAMSKGNPEAPERLQRCFDKMQRAPNTEPRPNRVLLFLPGGSGKGVPIRKRPPPPAVLRLPLEILGEIFILATGSPMDVDARETLLNSALVCKAWRHAALATHRLWSTLHLQLDPFNVPEDLYDGVSEWFQRAGSLPRSLELYSFGATGHRDLDESMRVFGEPQNLLPIIAKLLTSCRPPLTSLSLLNFTPESVERILRRLKTTASYPRRFLERLRIDFRVASQGRPWASDLDLFHNLPPVKYLDLHLNRASAQDTDYTLGEEDDWEDDSNPLSIRPSLLQGLNTLRIAGDWDVQDPLEMLKRCSTLQVLTLDHKDNLDLENAEDLGILVVDLPKLRVLRLQSLHQTDNNVTLLSVLKAPELEHLHLEFCTEEDCAHTPTSKPSSAVELSDSGEEADDEMEVDGESDLTSLSEESEGNSEDYSSNEHIWTALSTFLNTCQNTLCTVKISNHRLSSASLAKIMRNLGPHTRLELDEEVVSSRDP